MQPKLKTTEVRFHTAELQPVPWYRQLWRQLTSRRHRFYYDAERLDFERRVMNYRLGRW